MPPRASFDVLAWGQDDCVAWNTPMPNFNTQRPIAWTSGVLNNVTCEVEEQFVWTAAAQHMSNCEIEQWFGTVGQVRTMISGSGLPDPLGRGGCSRSKRPPPRPRS